MTTLFANSLTYAFVVGCPQVLEIGSVGKGLSQGQGAKKFFAHAEGVR
jgi:hypothetical protein